MSVKNCWQHANSISVFDIEKNIKIKKFHSFKHHLLFPFSLGCHFYPPEY